MLFLICFRYEHNICKYFIYISDAPCMPYMLIARCFYWFHVSAADPGTGLLECIMVHLFESTLGFVPSWCCIQSTSLKNWATCFGNIYIVCTCLSCFPYCRVSVNEPAPATRPPYSCFASLSVMFALLRFASRPTGCNRWTDRPGVMARPSCEDAPVRPSRSGPFAAHDLQS